MNQPEVRKREFTLLDVPLYHAKHRRLGWATKDELRGEIRYHRQNARWSLAMAKFYGGILKAMGKAKHVQQAVDASAVQRLYRKVP